MKNILYICFLIIHIHTSILYSQTFEKNVLIDIPGDNYDFNICTDMYPSYGYDSFITWVNENNSLYTVYLQMISPETSENIIISSDNNIKSNPNVAYNPEGGIRIAWQTNINNLWQISKCIYLNDSISQIQVLIDSLQNDPQISMSANQIAWIENGNLFLKRLISQSESVLIDSLNCISPFLYKLDDPYYTLITYIKKYADSSLILTIELPAWYTKTLFNGASCENPTIGMQNEIAFEVFEDQVWKIKYSIFYDSYPIETTNNFTSNYHNPSLLTYPVPTDKEQTPFLLALDTDSLLNNKEVIVLPFYYGYIYDLINLSDMPGDDYEPSIGYLTYNDTTYLSVFWLHTENNKTDIWMAKTVFDPIYNYVKDDIENLNSYQLYQNYPNPFNPVTIIEYYLPHASNVDIKIYDILGNEVVELLNEYQSKGKHKKDFSAGNLSSGIYIIKMNAGEYSKTSKMILLK